MRGLRHFHSTGAENVALRPRQSTKALGKPFRPTIFAGNLQDDEALKLDNPTAKRWPDVRSTSGHRIQETGSAAPALSSPSRGRPRPVLRASWCAPCAVLDLFDTWLASTGGSEAHRLLVNPDERSDWDERGRSMRTSRRERSWQTRSGRPLARGSVQLVSPALQPRVEEVGNVIEDRLVSVP